MELIDKSAVVAEIERRKKELIELSNDFANRWACGLLDNILSFLDTLKENKMDYKEKYEQALDNLKKIKAANKDNKELVDFIEYKYPELKESEDEKVRKWLIEMVEEVRKANPTNADHNGNCSEAIAWLEKRREKKPFISDDAIREGVAHFGITQYQITNWLKKYINVVNQKPTEWSEDDEIGLGNALWAIEQARTIVKDENDMGNLWYAEKWLKSLRSQPHWKPSEEQMLALGGVLDYLDESDNEDADIIRKLINDLKKL